MFRFKQRFVDKPVFIFGIGVFIVTAALLMTAQAAPAVADRFIGGWGVISTAEIDHDIFKLREERAMRALEEERKREVDTKKISTHRGIARATIKDHVPPEGKFIGIDLIEMTLTMFENGLEVGTTTILSKGRPGSHWETPSGSYAIRTKEENHFSSIGEVNMPWSMQFFGNFFIHGWPTYPSGEPVAEGYSGGCIRLSTPDAERVFRFAKAGTPIFIYDTDAIKDEPVPSLELLEVPLPSISAQSFVVADLEGGEILMEREAGKVFPIASITKLMTAIIANETISFDKKIDIGPPPSEDEQGGRIFREGERFTIGVLYQPLLTESSNQVARSIAAHYGTNRFVGEMNAKAKALGMKNTVFFDPTGIEPENVATADDLLSLVRHLKEKKRFLLNITARTSHTIISQDDVSYVIGNTMAFAQDADFLGGKTGFTHAAKETGVYLFRIGHEEFMRTIAIIVLGSENRDGDVRALREWLASSVQIPEIESAEEEGS